MEKRQKANIILSINDETLRLAAQAICRGDLVAFPTETVYGLGGDAFNAEALAKIFEAKGRPRFDPLIVHIASLQSLEKVADLSLLDAAARKRLDVLAEHFWPGPLTLILPKQKAVPELATSGLSTVAVRFPAHEVAQRLIALSTGAVAAPSANPFGRLSPTKAEHVFEGLGEKAGLILDGGSSRIGLESTVLDICQNHPRILRPGGIPKEAIEAVIGTVESGDGLPAEPSGGISSPGLLKSHYAPRVPLVIESLESLCRQPRNRQTAFLFFDGVSRNEWLCAQGLKAASEQTAAVAVLSEAGDLLEAAAHFFEALHQLDGQEIKRIYAQLAPDRGLGAAINDRLRRAAAA